MATSPWYREGTAKFTEGSTTVTGTGTRWVDFVRAGDGIQGPDGKLYQVTNVASNTSMSITPAYGSETTYWTIPIQGYVKRLADAASQLVRDFQGVDLTEAIDTANSAQSAAIAAQSTADASLKKSSNLSDISNAGAARQNLGLGTAATRNVGESSGNVMQVGAFGLGAAISDRVSNNFDEFYPTGVQGFWAASPAISPFGPPGAVLTMYGGGDRRGGQIYIQANGSPTAEVTVKARQLTPSGPTAVVEVLHTGNTLTTTGQSTEFPMTQKAVTDAINGISDERDKTDVNEINLGLEVIENLKTFSFKLNNRDWYRREAAKELIEVEEDGKVTVQEKINNDILSSPLSSFEENDGSLKRDDVYTGFVAQDLKETLKELGLDHLGIVKNYAEEYEGGEDRFYIEHLALLPFLVNSIKQLSARVKALEGRQGEEVE